MVADGEGAWHSECEAADRFLRETSEIAVPVPDVSNSVLLAKAG